MSPRAGGRGLKMPVCVRETEKKKKKKNREREGGRKKGECRVGEGWI